MLDSDGGTGGVADGDKEDDDAAIVEDGGVEFGPERAVCGDFSAEEDAMDDDEDADGRDGSPGGGRDDNETRLFGDLEASMRTVGYGSSKLLSARCSLISSTGDADKDIDENSDSSGERARELFSEAGEWLFMSIVDTELSAASKKPLDTLCCPFC